MYRSVTMQEALPTNLGLVQYGLGEEGEVVVAVRGVCFVSPR